MGRINSLDDWLIYQKNLHKQEVELGLKRIRSVYQKLFPQGVPFKVISVAGTNGKGTTCVFIESICRQAGIQVGRFSSPHILQYNERFSVNGNSANDQQICTAFERIEKIRGDTSLTYFEFSTLAALLIFQRKKVTVAVLEVGLGGRLDSVNVVDNDISVITNITLDHLDYLGNTREAIGFEKAGIMRTNIPCICGDLDPPKSLIDYAKQIGTPLEFVTEPYVGKIKLQGKHQRYNAALAIRVVSKFTDKVLPCHQQTGIEQAYLQGRLQTLICNNKTFVLDVAHNEAAVQVLATELANQTVPTLAIFSALKDKDIDAMIALMRAHVGKWLLIPLQADRAIDMDKLSDKFALHDSIEVCATMQNALNLAMNDRYYQRIVIFGSFYLIAEAIKALNNP